MGEVFMTTPHETGERDDNPNGEQSDDYRLTLSEYDALADAYLEAISTQHDGGTTPLANRWVKFFNRVRKAYPFMIKAIIFLKSEMEKQQDQIAALEREKGEIALDWDIQRRRGDRLDAAMKDVINAVDGYLAVTGNVCGVQPQRKRLIDALNAKIPKQEQSS
jgi:hypothetical protein